MVRLSETVRRCFCLRAVGQHQQGGVGHAQAHGRGGRACGRADDGPAGSTSASILQADTSGTGAPVSGYDSDGTFEGLADVLEQACDQIGEQQLGEEGLRATLCDERPLGPNGEDRGHELLTADWSALGLPVPGWGSDGFFSDVKNGCESIPFIVAILTGQQLPVEETTVGEEGASVTLCAD